MENARAANVNSIKYIHAFHITVSVWGNGKCMTFSYELHGAAEFSPSEAGVDSANHVSKDIYFYKFDEIKQVPFPKPMFTPWYLAHWRRWATKSSSCYAEAGLT